MIDHAGRIRELGQVERVFAVTAAAITICIIYPTSYDFFSTSTVPFPFVIDFQLTVVESVLADLIGKGKDAGLVD